MLKSKGLLFSRKEIDSFDKPLYKKIMGRFKNFKDFEDKGKIDEKMAKYYKYWGCDFNNRGLDIDQIFLSKYASKGKGLDIGCGHNKCHPNAIGYDIFPFMAVDLIGDARDLLMFKDNELDFIVGAHVLEHMPDVKAVLNEWKRVVKIGGIIAVIVPDGEQHPIWIRSSGHKINLGPKTLGILFKKVLKMKLVKCGIVPKRKGGRNQSAFAIAQKI